MRQRTIFETVRDTFPVDGLLANASDHLRNIDVRAFRPGLGHNQCTVRWVQLAETSFRRQLSNAGKFLENHSLERLLWCASGLALQRSASHFVDISIAFLVAFLQECLLLLEQSPARRDIADAEGKPAVHHEI